MVENLITLQIDGTRLGPEHARCFPFGGVAMARGQGPGHIPVTPADG